jgi:hypothetical protein
VATAMPKQWDKMCLWSTAKDLSRVIVDEEYSDTGPAYNPRQSRHLSDSYVLLVAAIGGGLVLMSVSGLTRPEYHR